METSTNAQIMKILPETPAVKWLRVSNVVEPYDKVALLEDDVFFRLEVFGLTRADLITWLVEKESGTSFVTKSGKIFLSSNTAISMLEESNNPDTERFKTLTNKIYTQAVSIYYPEKQNVRN